MFRSVKEFRGCAVGAFLLTVLLIGVDCPRLATRSTTHPPTDALSQASEIAEQVNGNAPSIDAAAFNKTMADIDVLDANLELSFTA